jgi:hypothetical protein
MDYRHWNLEKIFYKRRKNGYTTYQCRGWGFCKNGSAPRRSVKSEIYCRDVSGKYQTSE